MRAANVMYEMPEGRPIWKTLPLRLGHHRRARRDDGGRRGGRGVHRRPRRAGRADARHRRHRPGDLEHRQVAGAGRHRDRRAGAALLVRPQRRAPRLPLDHPRQHRRGRLLDRRLGRVRLLRRQLRHLQQDLRDPGRGDRLPRLAAGSPTSRCCWAWSSTPRSPGAAPSRRASPPPRSPTSPRATPARWTRTRCPDQEVRPLAGGRPRV